MQCRISNCSTKIISSPLASNCIAHTQCKHSRDTQHYICSQTAPCWMYVQIPSDPDLDVCMASLHGALVSAFIHRSRNSGMLLSLASALLSSFCSMANTNYPPVHGGSRKYGLCGRQDDCGSWSCTSRIGLPSTCNLHRLITVIMVLGVYKHGGLWWSHTVPDQVIVAGHARSWLIYVAAWLNQPALMLRRDILLASNRCNVMRRPLHCLVPLEFRSLSSTVHFET